MLFSDYPLHYDSFIRPTLLWEYDLEHLDIQKMRNIIVQRMLERGRKDNYYAILNMYGLEGVKEALKEIPYMSEKDMNFACFAFDIKKEDLKCYKLKQSHQQHFTS